MSLVNVSFSDDAASIVAQASASTGKCRRARITIAWPSMPSKLPSSVSVLLTALPLSSLSILKSDRLALRVAASGQLRFGTRKLFAPAYRLSECALQATCGAYRLTVSAVNSRAWASKRSEITLGVQDSDGAPGFGTLLELGRLVGFRHGERLGALRAATLSLPCNAQNAANSRPAILFTSLSTTAQSPFLARLP